MMEFLQKPWPWYIAGPMIGLMVPTLYYLANKPFGLSSSLRHICAACFPANVSFFKYNWKKEIWSLFFVVGIVLGGFISQGFLTDGKPIAISESTRLDLIKLGITNFDTLLPSDLFSWSALFTLPGFIFLVIGGFLVGFGSRYAGGCTSGHAITGLSNFQGASLVAVIGFFIGGLTVTYLVLPYIIR
jgi:uncharacterized membrane protein YedE/YeeE